MSIAATVVNFAPSAFVPLALGFFGLGTGYLIYGPQELAGYPQRDRRVDVATISPRTVQYHLHKVFAKLQISSRTQLERVLPVDVDVAQPV